MRIFFQVFLELNYEIRNKNIKKKNRCVFFKKKKKLKSQKFV
jgi:hypothetical protein